MARDSDAITSLGRRPSERTGTEPARVLEPKPATAPASPDEEPAGVDEFKGRPRHRRRIRRRYLATIGAGSVLVATVVGLAAAYATAKGTPRYQSLALVEVDQPRAIAISPDDGIIAKLSRLRYKYAGLIRTETFEAPVAKKLNLGVGVIASSLFVRIDPSSLLIGVGAHSSNPAEAQRIADAAAQGVVDYAGKEQAADKIPAAEQVTFTVVTPAVPAMKVSPTHSRIVLVGVGTFVFIVAGSLAFGYLWRYEY
jgi:capsular polysaccharide biosynthesis protein